MNAIMILHFSSFSDFFNVNFLPEKLIISGKVYYLSTDLQCYKGIYFKINLQLQVALSVEFLIV